MTLVSGGVPMSCAVVRTGDVSEPTCLWAGTGTVCLVQATGPQPTPTAIDLPAFARATATIRHDMRSTPR